MPTLFIYPKRRDAYDYFLSGGKVYLGRASTNDIVLFDEFSSGCHAAIFPVGTGYVIEDQESKNGTFLNGRRINKDALLKRGDEILIGSTRIVFDSKMETDLEIIDDTVRYAKSFCDDIEWSAMDATRSDVEFLSKAVETAILTPR